MTINVARILVSMLFSLVGYQSAMYVTVALAGTNISPTMGLSYLILGAIVGAAGGWLIAPFIIRNARSRVERIVQTLQRTPVFDIVVGAIGLIVGMLIGVLGTFTLPRALPFIGNYLPIMVTVSFGYIGVVVALRKREEIQSLIKGRAAEKSQTNGKIEKNNGHTSACLLDTSVIIDGRILDICRSGFINEKLIVPNFVLLELQHIADSTDSLRRNRGRRGLDILAQLQQLPETEIAFTELDYDDVGAVDTKLVRIAREIDAKILTNDYNLNKVAELQGVKVLNINELANAVKPIAIPGETMEVRIVKDGKEAGQGIGYLEDGTMIVVENGRKRMGQTVVVTVTSVLQTAAGRMIFAKVSPNQNRENVESAVHSTSVSSGQLGE